MSLIKPDKTDDLDYNLSIYKEFLSDPKMGNRVYIKALGNLCVFDYFTTLIHKAHKVQDSLKKVKVIRKKKNV